MRSRLLLVALVACVASALVACSTLLGTDLTGGEDGEADSGVPPPASDASSTEAPDVATLAPESGAPSRYAAAVLADAPLAYYRLSEASGDVIVDASGNGRNATLRSSGAASRGAPGALPGEADTAVDLGGEAYVDCGDLFDFAGRVPFSFEVWVKPKRGAPAFNLFDKLVRRPADGFPVDGMYLFYAAPRLSFEHWVTNGSGSGATWGVDDRSGALAEDVFTHVVVTFDGTVPRLFVNGAATATGYANGDALDTAKPLYFGQLLAGVLDEVAVYGTALSPARIAAHVAAAR